MSTSEFWVLFFFFFSSRRRHTRLQGDWSSDVCSSDLVGQVHDVEHLVARRFEVAAQQVLEQKRAEVPEVRVVPDGGAAGVERDPRGRERLERLDAAGQRVVERERHARRKPTSSGIPYGIRPPRV